MDRATKLLVLFCDVYDFCQTFMPLWEQTLLENNLQAPRKEPRLALSEILTIIIHFHQSHYRDFKAYYVDHVRVHLRAEFPQLVSYNRFVELMPRTLLPLCCYLDYRQGECTGIAFIDSTKLAVCGNKRIKRNKVFQDVAKLGKSAMGWFFGFKLHLVVNDQGELLAFTITPANTDDPTPVPEMVKDMFGKIFGDKGYLSQPLFEKLLAQGLTLVTAIRKNMKNKLVPMMDKLLGRKRAIIETINDQLKNISQIEHSRHRSVTNCMVNILAGLAAYTLQEKKPAIKFNEPKSHFSHELILL
jgi:hypothetical protein